MPPEAALHNRAAMAHLLKDALRQGYFPLLPHYILK
jgi:hypothetical protein